MILFKTGYSFISTPVTLGSNDGKAGIVEEARVGPLPSFAVHGTVALQPDDDSVQLLSLGRRQEEDLQLLLPEGEDLSMPAFLAANMNTLVNLTLAEDASDEPGEAEGRVRWVQPPGGASRLALLQLTQGQGKRDLLLDTAKIVNIERLQDNEERDVKTFVTVVMIIQQGGRSCTGARVAPAKSPMKGRTYADNVEASFDKKITTYISLDNFANTG